MGIYSNNASGTDAGTLLTISNQTGLVDGWNLVSLNPTITMTGGVTYWQGVETDATARVGTAYADENEDYTPNTFGTLPSTWPGTNSNYIQVDDFAIYYNLCP